ncbi:BON domain-containing protein [Pedobacter sp. ISL-68]|uniref:BON domain-containing protein n=1 Tax=unclassified Pedobacter TaxID=2628915 RepID=UPI001BEAD741|nr:MULTISPECIES: BON domain-containing protein [unclassified Pedobacter]MBT2562991.1 BON domain-containing protein [Pedobacter sp. ISL-64]MBT2592995.1 BON domain-containing protein [Pedobacter sp. ISL-68]
MMRRSKFGPLIMEIIMKKKNKKLAEEVRLAITTDSLIGVEKIEISVEDGLVTLKGSVDSYAKKLAAEHVAKSVKGVKNVIQKIEVRFSFKSNLIVYMGANLTLDSKHAYKNDNDQPMHLIGPLHPDLHFERSTNEIW